MALTVTPVGATIDQTRVIEFSERLFHRMEQMNSRLMPYGEIRYFAKGKEMTFDSLGGGLEAEDANIRFADTKFADLEHSRRRILPRRFQLSLPWDRKDQLETFFDIQNNYESKIVGAMERKIDRVILAALMGDVWVGENFATQVNASDDGVLTIDATAGLTYETLLQIDQNFIDRDLGIDIDSLRKLLTLTGAEHTALMKEQKLTSGDYSRQYHLEKGRMQQACGFDFIKYAANPLGGNPMLPVNSGVRNLVALAENAFCVGIQDDIKVELRRHESKVDTWYVQCTGTFGAVRTEGSRTQIVNVAAA